MSSAADPVNVVKLAPSDLTFLWDECQRCFWLKAKGVLKRPSAPFPKIFTRLDGQTKDFFGKRAEEMAVGLHAGRAAFGDRRVRSAPLAVPGHDIGVVIGGKIDTALAFDDGTYGVIDFKTSDPKPEHVMFSGRQLHSYALAVENPALGALELSPVTQLGLLCVEPIAMVGLDGDVAYKGSSHSRSLRRVARASPNRRSSVAAVSTCGSSMGRTTQSRPTLNACGTERSEANARQLAASLRLASRAWSGLCEALRRVHECAFAVLAMESEPVDPRL